VLIESGAALQCLAHAPPSPIRLTKAPPLDVEPGALDS